MISYKDLNFSKKDEKNQIKLNAIIEEYSNMLSIENTYENLPIEDLLMINFWYDDYKKRSKEKEEKMLDKLKIEYINAKKELVNINNEFNKYIKDISILEFMDLNSTFYIYEFPDYTSIQFYCDCGCWWDSYMKDYEENWKEREIDLIKYRNIIKKIK